MTTTHRRPGRPRRFVCPPSGEKVLQALDDAGRPLPHGLREAAHLPRRTMYFALECLSKLGLVRSGTTLHDTRRSRYVLDPGRRDGARQPCLMTGECNRTRSRHIVAQPLPGRGTRSASCTPTWSP